MKKTTSKRAPRSLLQRRVEFARKNWRAPGGEAFEIDEAGWLYQEYWRPLHSFRAVAMDLARLCSKCQTLAGDLVEQYSAPACLSGGRSCAGLCYEPITFVLLDLPRRSGKTVGTSGFVASALFRGERESIAFISGSEDQSGRLFEEHYGVPIRENPALAERCAVTGTQIKAWASAQDKALFERTGSPSAPCRFNYTSTSISGTTGGKNTVVVIDEAREVPGPVFAALAPSTWDQNGWECPTGARRHTHTRGDLDSPTRTTCAECGAGLVPYTGRVLAMSSAGEKTGGSKDWFFDTCDSILAPPEGVALSLDERRGRARFHVYRAQGIINRRVAESSVNATAMVLGKVESLRDSIEIETSNTAKRRGEAFLTYNDILACVDKGLSNRESGQRPGVAFLDLSSVRDPSSLVILEDDSLLPADGRPGEDPWLRVVTTRIEVFDPTKKNHDVVREGNVDYKALEAHLDEVVPLFKLLRLRVDDRHEAEARRFLARLKAKPWGRIVIGCTELTRDDRRFSYIEVERRFLGRLIRIQDVPELRQELVGARKFKDIDNRIDVREAGSRNKRGVRHLDVAESLAGACLDVHAMATKTPRAGVTRSPSGGPGRRVGPATSRIFGALGGDSW